MAKRLKDLEKAFGTEMEDHRLFADAWMNNGYSEVLGEKLLMEDFMATSNAQYWLPKTIEEVVREPVEPLTIIPQLLDRIEHRSGARITFPAVGSLAAFDLAEGQAYPEQQLDISPGTMTVQIGKTGLAFKISEEMRKNSRFDIINLHLRQARRALDRHKELKGFRMISGMGTTLFDNASPATSVFGVCTGRDISGSGNGSCTMEDLVKGYSHLMMQGFRPNVILVHPMTWSIWMADPLMQAIVKNTGNGSWFQPTNMAQSSRPWDNASQGGLGKSSGTQYTPGGNAAGATATGVKELDQTLASKPVIPSYFPEPLNVVVSPFVPYDTDNDYADIILCDADNLGALIVEEDVVVDEWEDKSVDLTKIKLRERYDVGIYHDGLGIGVFRNVPVEPNRVALPVDATVNGLTEISPTASVL